MAVQFDPEIWNKRAWRRLERAMKKGNSDREAVEEWTRDMRAIEGIARVVSWCEGRKINVKFVKRSGGTYDHLSREINIAGRCRPQLQLHYLLHECGHVLIGTKESTDRFGKGYSQLWVEPNAERLNEHRLDVLEEEFEAWHRGWKLAMRVGALTPGDREDYHKTRTYMVGTYVKWAARVKGW